MSIRSARPATTTSATGSGAPTTPSTTGTRRSERARPEGVLRKKRHRRETSGAPARTGARASPASRYETRLETVHSGKRATRILVAVFPLASDGEVLVQLADEAGLRRGGVYLRGPGRPPRAPRFDEVFRDVAAKARHPALRRALVPLVERARKAARATRPRLTPGV